MNLDQKRLEELKAQQETAAQVQQLELLFRQRATPEALQRYGNLKMGHHKKALQVLFIFAKMIQAGKVSEITDDLLKSVLMELDEKKEFTIKRK